MFDEALIIAIERQCPPSCKDMLAWFIRAATQRSPGYVLGIAQLAAIAKKIGANTPSSTPTGVAFQLRVRADDSSVKASVDALDQLNTDLFEQRPGYDECETMAKETIEDIVSKAEVSNGVHFRSCCEVLNLPYDSQLQRLQAFHSAADLHMDKETNYHHTLREKSEKKLAEPATQLVVEIFDSVHKAWFRYDAATDSYGLNEQIDIVKIMEASEILKWHLEPKQKAPSRT